MITKLINEQWELEVLLDELSRGLEDDISVVINSQPDGSNYVISTPVAIEGNYIVDFTGNRANVPILFNGTGSLDFAVLGVSFKDISIIPAVTNTISMTFNHCEYIDLMGFNVNPTVKGVQPLLVKDCGSFKMLDSNLTFITNDTSARGLVCSRCEYVNVTDCKFTRGNTGILTENVKDLFISLTDMEDIYTPIITGTDSKTNLTITQSEIVIDREDKAIIRTTGSIDIALQHGTYGNKATNGFIIECADPSPVNIKITNGYTFGRPIKNGSTFETPDVRFTALYSSLNYTADSSAFMFSNDNISVYIDNSVVDTAKFMDINAKVVSITDSTVILRNMSAPRIVNNVIADRVTFTNNFFKLVNPSHFHITSDHGIYVNNYFDLIGNLPKDTLLKVTGEGNSFANNITSSNQSIGGEDDE